MSTTPIYALILELNRLKTVFRNNTTLPERKESTAEHSWTVSMITLVLMPELKKEFPKLDELKTLKLAMIHDVVEIYAGDVMAFDTAARKNKEADEVAALEKLAAIYPTFGEQLRELWHEFEDRTTIEAKIAKAADAICPIFLRVQSRQSYIPFHLTIANLETTKRPHFTFSQSFMVLYEQLKTDLLSQGLIEEKL